MSEKPFSLVGTPQRVTVTSSGLLVALTAWSQSWGGTLVLTVLGAVDVFVAIGSSGVTCTTSNGYPVFGRTKEALSCPNSPSHLYLICASGSSVDVVVSQGQGE